MVNQLQTTSALRKLLLGISLYFAYLLGTWLVNDHGWWTLIGRVVLVVGIVGIISLELQTTRLLSPKVFTAPQRRLTWWYMGCFFLVYVVGIFGLPYNLWEVVHAPFKELMMTMVVAIGAGFLEEFLVRGLFLAGFAQLWQQHTWGVPGAVIASAVVFGLLHLSNLTYQSPLATGQQVLYAMVMGLALGLIRVGTNGLTMPIILHSLMDCHVSVNSGNQAVAWGMLLAIFGSLMVISLVGLWQWHRWRA